MSNVSLLLGRTDDSPVTDYEPPGSWRVASYSVPLLWLSLFSAEHVVSWPSTLDADDTYTALVAPTAVAVELSRGRLAQWAERWPEMAPMVEAWPAYVLAGGAPFVAVWTEDISAMSGDEEWAEVLAGHLASVDDLDGDGFDDTLEQGFVEQDGDALVGVGTPLHLALAGHPQARPGAWD